MGEERPKSVNGHSGARHDVRPSATKAKYGPAFAYHFHIRPWEWDLLLWSEVKTFVAACDELAKDPQK